MAEIFDLHLSIFSNSSAGVPLRGICLVEKIGMRKRKRGRKFGREKDLRRAMRKQLASSLVVRRSLVTNEARAKEIRSVIEKLVSRARKQTLAGRRMLAQHLSSEAAKALFTDIAPKFSAREGGYTRIIKLPPRKSDGARMAKIEFVE